MWTAKRARDERRREELQAVLVAHCHALDRLALEIGQLPPSPGRTVTGLSATVERAPMLNWMMGQTSQHTLGRPAMRAIDALMASAARLTLVAPPDILRASEPIAALLSRFDVRDAQWDKEFAQARQQFVAASRAALAPQPKVAAFVSSVTREPQGPEMWPPAAGLRGEPDP